MKALRKLKSADWENNLKNYAELSTRISIKFGKLTFPPSRELLTELKNNFSNSVIEEYENGHHFSSYKVYYEVNGQEGEIIYKTTDASYPFFHDYKSMEAYKSSFSGR
jgi:hypothetical protein